VQQVKLDGVTLPDGVIPLDNDGTEHEL